MLGAACMECFYFESLIFTYLPYPYCRLETYILRAFIKRHFIKITAITLTSKQKHKTIVMLHNVTHIIKSEINCENQFYWGNRWIFKHLLNDDTEFALRIEVGKLFHRAGTPNKKLLSAAVWSAFLWNFGTERRVLSCAERSPVRVWW